jgi:hypothetical protein
MLEEVQKITLSLLKAIVSVTEHINYVWSKGSKYIPRFVNSVIRQINNGSR